MRPKTLLAKSEFLDEGAVAFQIRALEILEESLALSDKLHHAAL